MRIKYSVSLRGLASQMTAVMIVGQQVCDKYDVEFVITCGMDGLHMEKSRHWSGEALDVRSRDLKYEDVEDFANDLRKALGKEFTVIVHKTHIHVQFN